MSGQTVTYLGVTLDQSLSGDVIANKVVSKCTNKVKFLYRNAKQFDLKKKKLLVSALIQCQFDYACTSWYCGLTKRYQSRLQVAQNKVIRFMLNLPPRSHVGVDEFQLVGMLPVEYRVKQLKLNHMFNIFNDKSPDYMKGQFPLLSSGHHTRNNVSNFAVPRVESFGINSFKYTGTKLWNSLPLSVKSLRSKFDFKKAVKSYLISEILVCDRNDFMFY